MDNQNEQTVATEIDKEKLKRMIVKIYALERENSKTGKRNEKEMKNEIQNIIEEEVKACY